MLDCAYGEGRGNKIGNGFAFWGIGLSDTSYAKLSRELVLRMNLVKYERMCRGPKPKRSHENGNHVLTAKTNLGTYKGLSSGGKTQSVNKNGDLQPFIV